MGMKVCPGGVCVVDGMFITGLRIPLLDCGGSVALPGKCNIVWMFVKQCSISHTSITGLGTLFLFLKE